LSHERHESGEPCPSCEGFSLGIQACEQIQQVLANLFPNDTNEQNNGTVAALAVIAGHLDALIAFNPEVGRVSDEIRARVKADVVIVPENTSLQ
jgi:hypothetical protein